MRIHSQRRILGAVTSLVALASMMIAASASSGSASERDSSRAHNDDRQTSRGVSWE